MLSERDAMIDEKCDRDAKIAKMLAYGFPRNEEEMQLWYSIQNGELLVPQGAAWEFDKWYNGADKTAEGFQSGIFSIRRVIQAPRQNPNPLMRHDLADPSNQGVWNLPRFTVGPTQTGGFNGYPGINNVRAAAPSVRRAGPLGV